MFAIFTDRERRNQAANGEFVDIGGNAGLFEPLAETIDYELKDRAKRSAKQVSPPKMCTGVRR